MTYDPLGRLVTTQASGTTTRLVYDGDDLVAEYNGATLLRRYLHGPGTDDPLVQYEGTTVASTAARFLYSDAQGSIIATTDNAGNLMLNGINKYDEYGIPQTDSSGHSLNSGRFQYTGQQWIGELGMYYYKARFYSPTLGRFMQTDPVGYQGGINIYEYALDDPVDHDDPSGLQSCPTGSAPANCPDIPLPARDVREELQKEVKSSSGEGERGGQALQDDKTGNISYRTGDKAGTGTSGEFSHNPAPPGSHTILRSHTHLTDDGTRGVEAQARRRGQNAPSTDDQVALQRGGAAVQTIGPDVTTTLFRKNQQDYLVIDSGRPAMVPDVTSQHIIVCSSDQCPK